MLTSRFSFILYCVTLLIIGSQTIARGEDWPQWQGPRRDSVWNETGLLQKFSAAGPRQLWKAPLSAGYAGPAVANGRVYVTDFESEEADITSLGFQQKRIPGKERVHCLDAKTGKILWQFAYAVTYNIQYPGGPRCTPTVHEGLVYTLGAMGDLHCLTAEKGEVRWSKNFLKDFNAKTPVWGNAAHPLVVDNLLIVTPGGEGKTAVALDRLTGKEVWHALDAPPGYAPPTLIAHGGKRQLLILDTKSLNSLDPASGELLWTQPIAVDFGMPVMSPRLSGDLLYVCGVERTAALFKLSGGDKPSAEVVWRAKPKEAIFTVNSSPFIQDDYVYGANVDGEFVCAKLASGERVWSDFAPTTGTDLGGRKNRSGTSFIIKNGNRFFLMSETGELIIANLNPTRYEEVSRAKIIEPTGTAWDRPIVWSHPAFADKCVFARNDKEIVCVSLE